MDTKTKRQGQHGIPEGYYGLQDICRIIGRSRSSVYRMFSDAERRLPKPYKSGKQLLWDKHEMDRFVKNGKFLKR
jgi:predicted DNA-binding transcriptional regulator AlpA